MGVLLELIGKSGGHLWMAAEPSGNMVLKIHLPQSVSDGLTDAHAPSPAVRRRARDGAAVPPLTREDRSGRP